MTESAKNDIRTSGFLIGSNYWPGTTGIRMWSEWQPTAIKSDLAQMVSMGFNVCRSFLFVPDFLPKPGRVEPKMLDRFRIFLSLCVETGIQTIPTLFVGHMSGEDWEVSWRRGRNFFSNPELLGIQKRYVQEVVRSTEASTAIAGWIASNEICNYEPNATSEEFAQWGRHIAGWIKECDPTHPVSLGEGAHGPEINRKLPNFETRKCVDYLDFIGLHFYPRTGNYWRQSFTAAFRVRLAQFWHIPVLIEEFGHSTTMGSENNQALYYRKVLYSAFINGAVGALNWCFSDFDLPHERPYRHHPFEMRFGLVRTNGDVRPAGIEMSAFAATAHELSNPEWERLTEPETGLLFPSNYFYTYPHDYDSGFPDWYPLYLDTFMQMKRAGLNPIPILEPAVELEKDGRLSHSLKLDIRTTPVIFIPRLKRLRADFWKELIAFVREGGILYASFAQDLWLQDWEEIIGINSDLDFGVERHRSGETLRLHATGSWARKFPTSFTLPIVRDPECAFCPVLKSDAEILLIDQEDQPVLVKQPVGDGYFYFATTPLEMMNLKDNRDRGADLLQAIYSTIWDSHQPKTSITHSGADLEFGFWRNQGRGQSRILVLNHAPERRTGSIVFQNDITGKILSKNNHLEVDKNRMAFSLEKGQVLDVCLAV